MITSQDLQGIDAWLQQYQQRPDHHPEAVRRINDLTEAVHDYAKLLGKASTALYVILQTAHRGQYILPEAKLAEFGLDKPVNVMVDVRFDHASRAQVYSVPPEDRKMFTADDDKPVWGPDDNAPAAF